MTSILVTGGCGFIGSHFVKMMLNKYPNYTIVNLDALTYAGDTFKMSSIMDNQRYVFIKGDICNVNLVNQLFSQYDFKYVVNFAAESHVDRSICEPNVFLKTNILGTQNLLENAKNHWSVARDCEINKYKRDVKFVQISTDEVYGSLGCTGKFSENSMIKPNSPYSASKASADLLVKAYHETYELPINITRCSNNYGTYQFPEKLIPLMISNALLDKFLPVYGDGKQVRDWIHVTDHCEAIDLVLHQGYIGEVYNIGGNCEKENIEIVYRIIDVLDKPKSLIKHVNDRLGHDKRYAVEFSKIETELGWRPRIPFDQGIVETIKWYRDDNKWLEFIKTNRGL